MKVGTLVVSIIAVAAYPFWVKAIFCPFHGKIATIIDDCGPFVSSPVLCDALGRQSSSFRTYAIRVSRFVLLLSRDHIQHGALSPI
jgi:hypothetical protein